MFLLCSQMYILLFILIFLATVSVPVSLLSIRHNLSDCKQTFREYDYIYLKMKFFVQTLQAIKCQNSPFKLILYATTDNIS